MQRLLGPAPTTAVEDVSKGYVDGVVAPLAPLASPALTGTPTAPTAAVGTNTTQVATTAHVFAAAALRVAISSVSNSQVFTKDSSGNVAGTGFGSAVSASLIVQRDTSGQVLVPGSPTSSTHATSKSYVDSGSGDMNPATTLSPGSTSTSLAALASRTLRVSLTANATFTISNGITGSSYTQTLILVQDTTGSRTVTWPSGVKWDSGTKPTLSTAASAIDIVTLLWTGTEWVGFLGAKGVA